MVSDSLRICIYSVLGYISVYRYNSDQYIEHLLYVRNSKHILPFQIFQKNSLHFIKTRYKDLHPTLPLVGSSRGKKSKANFLF